MKNLLYPLIVFLSYYSFGQSDYLDGQVLTSVKDVTVNDFVYQNNRLYTIQSAEKESFLRIYSGDELLVEKSISDLSNPFFEQDCRGNLVVLTDDASFEVQLSDEQELELRASQTDCLKAPKYSLPTISSTDGNARTVKLNDEDSIVISFSDDPNVTLKTPGRTADLSATTYRSHRYYARGQIPHSYGRYATEESNMERARQSQYRRGGFVAKPSPVEYQLFADKKELVVFSNDLSKQARFSLRDGELIEQKNVEVTRPAVWVKDVDYLAQGDQTGNLYFISRNSTGIQFYTYDTQKAEAIPFFKEKRSKEILSWDETTEGVTYVVRENDSLTFKFVSFEGVID